MPTMLHCPNPACGRSQQVSERPGPLPRCRFCGQPLAPSETLTGGLEDGQAPRQELPCIGGFRLLTRVGVGAFGTVYRARDLELGREAAVKIAHPGSWSGAEQARRFLREARALARLQHPSIVPVYAAGQEGKHLYLAAAFVRGQSLADAVRDGPFEPRRAAQVVRTLAEALAHAHERGVVHRDVKPANVLLDENDEPHLLDFGLSHLRQDSRLTQDGAQVGTPLYMAPEQIRGQHGDPLPASDQYSLGVVLYQLLSGQLPFTGSVSVVLHDALHAAPRSLRSLRPELPRDLERICMQAMAREPESRYASCQDLADDLRRFLEGEPVRARRRGPVERLLRWLGREPIVALAALGAILCLAIVTAVALASAARFEAQRQAEEAEGQRAREAQALAQSAHAQAMKAEHDESEARTRADRQREQARAALDRAHRARQEVEQAIREEVAEEGRLRRARDKRAAERRVEADAERAAAEQSDRALVARSEAESSKRLLRTLAVRTRSLAYSADGSHLACACDREVRIFNSLNFREEVKLPAPNCARVIWSPDDGGMAWVGSGDGDHGGPVTLLAVGGRRGMLAADGKLVEARCLAFSPDGKYLVCGGAAVQVWERSSGRLLRSLRGHAARITGVALDPTGPRLVSASADGRVCLWDVDRGEELLVFRGHRGPVRQVHFSPDGRQVVSVGSEADGNQAVKVWNASDGKVVFSLGAARAVAWRDDGKYLATAAGTAVILWDARTGKKVFLLDAHLGKLTALAFRPRGAELAAADEDGKVRVWDVTGIEERGRR